MIKSEYVCLYYCLLHTVVYVKKTSPEIATLPCMRHATPECTFRT